MDIPLSATSLETLDFLETFVSDKSFNSLLLKVDFCTYNQQYMKGLKYMTFTIRAYSKRHVIEV